MTRDRDSRLADLSAALDADDPARQQMLARSGSAYEGRFGTWNQGSRIPCDDP